MTNQIKPQSHKKLIVFPQDKGGIGKSFVATLLYRRYLGKELIHYTNRKGKTTAESLVSAYRRESDRQKALIRKAKITETKLLFITAAFKKLMQDDNFINLLRAEKLSTMPANLAANLKVTAEATK